MAMSSISSNRDWPKTLGFYCFIIPVLFVGCGDEADSGLTPSATHDALNVVDVEPVDPSPGGDGCGDRWCGDVCDDGRFCYPDGVCREIPANAEDYVSCPVCVDAACGASCQPACAIGRLCGFIAPGYCNIEGECILESPDSPGERPFQCPAD